MSDYDQAQTLTPATLSALLRKLGAVQYDLMLPETHSLIDVLHADEHMLGILYGRYKQYQTGRTLIGRGALVATDQRVILIDSKPLFIRNDELSYKIVSGVTYTKAGIAGTVVLHTRIGDIAVRTFNAACARNFIEAIEAQIFSQTKSY